MIQTMKDQNQGQVPKTLKKKTSAKKRVRRDNGQNYSQNGNEAASFKSVTSYMLGDLDMSHGESDLSNSFDISSNSSQSGNNDSKAQAV